MTYEEKVRSAPHPRGCSREVEAVQHGMGVGPAPAGMLRRMCDMPELRPCRPRTRGDAPMPPSA